MGEQGIMVRRKENDRTDKIGIKRNFGSNNYFGYNSNTHSFNSLVDKVFNEIIRDMVIKMRPTG